MTQHKQVHSFVVGDSYGGIYLLLEAWVLVYFERVCHLVSAPISDKALFKNEWCILLHILDPAILLAIFIYDNIELLDGRLVEFLQLTVHFNNLASLLSDHVVELTSEVL